MASGTSCSAPLWAGFMALVNEQAATAAKPPAGFINPAVYALGQATNYTDYFHDTTVGDNYWSSSPTNFPAAPGYDLCTGWGTPVGQPLMTALVGPPEPLGVLPDSSFIASGVAGGPFSATFQNFTLTNFSGAPLNWSIISTASWLDISANSGTLAVTDQVPVTVSLNATANSLTPGTYVATVGFTNATSGILQNHLFTLFIADLLVLRATNDFIAQGPVEGPFIPASFSLTLTNQGGTNLDWSFGVVPSWLSISASNGTLVSNDSTNIDLELVGAEKLPAGIYSAVLVVTNVTWASVESVPVRLEIGQSVVQNGGFETGDFTDWTLVGDTVTGHLTYNVVATSNNFPDIVHSGNFGAFLGEGGFLATLTQTLPTIPGQCYQLSFWLNNPLSASPQEFAARWNGTNLIDLVDPPVLMWTNYQFIVIAEDTNTDLQFAAQNDPNYFGLDDVAVTPIPPLHFKDAAVSSNEFNLAWFALAGLNYEIQVTTNLVPANWQTVTGIVAATNVCSFVDTNRVSDVCSRFYRLVLVP
ncbi:MAG: hypothetical protein JF609_07255, partial [Verrucomicrobia bacterium]|nr:hypothetical protein [Verrucomicrobiota bacterium]